MTDLVRDTLRLRPDRIVIGKVRDGSALDLLKDGTPVTPAGWRLCTPTAQRRA